jgi:hypothetical protein
MAFDYKTSYEEAKAELARVQIQKLTLGRQIEECDRQIAALTQTMRAIAPLVGEEPPPDVQIAPDAETPPGGMTDCVRALLKKATEPLTASEIRESLEAIGFDMNSYSNPLATIHTVLRRLTESGEVETTHEMLSAKKFTIPVSKHLAVEKIVGKGFRIGEKRGFIGVGRLVRRSRTSESTRPSESTKEAR